MRKVYLIGLILSLSISSLVFAQEEEEEMEFTPEEVETAEEAPPEEEEELGIPEPEVMKKISTKPKKGPPLKEEKIVAVVRIYALKKGRFELTPGWGFSLNDPLVQHMAFIVYGNYFVTNVLSVGLSYLQYQPFNITSDLEWEVRKSVELVTPVNEYQLGANLNFAYYPLHGKFAIFNKWIMYWEMWLGGGVGMLRSRPIAKIEPTRAFSFKNRISGSIGVGLRAYFTRWLGVTLEYRDYIFLDQQENTDRKGPKYQKEGKITHNMMLFMGASFFFPFKVVYRLPR
jgi:outer membrane beta-barrel protein